jgi:acetyl-CoA synthetase
VGGGAAAPFSEHWRWFRALDAARAPGDPPVVTWEPDATLLAECNAARMIEALRLSSFEDLHRWSVSNRGAWWGRVVRTLGIEFEEPAAEVLDLSRGPEHAGWFEGARLNIVASCFRGDRGRAAVISGSEGSDALRVTTLGELERLVDRVVHGLRSRGLAPGEAVALYMPMNLECVAAYLGVVKAGLRVVSIADSFPAPELARRLDIGGARLVITAEGFRRAGRVHDLLARVREAGSLPAVVVPLDRSATLRAEETWWDDFLGEDVPAAHHIASPDAVTNILFSSGTTGAPKAIPWTHLTPIKAAADAHFHHDLRPGDVAVWPTNIGWMMGPWLIYASLLNDATIGLFEGAPTGREFCEFVGRAKTTMLGVVPSLVKAWRSSGATGGTDWSSVRVYSSTGEASGREDFLWLSSRNDYRAPVIEYCGGTEVGGGHITGSVMQPASPAVFTTPALGGDFAVLDEEGCPVKEGATGELFLVPSWPGLSQTLLNGDHHAIYYEGCPAGPAGAVLRRHGDAVTRLPGGRWRAEGRADDTMNLGGIKVSSLEIERVANAHADVHESAAVAVRPGGEGADALVLFVVPAAGATPDPVALRGALQTAIAANLNPLFRIHDLVLVEALPRTASQKILRRELRVRWTSG